MARVTSLEVLKIIDTELLTQAAASVGGFDETTSALEPFITAANIMVTNAIPSDADYGATQLKEIERWWAAHNVAIRDPRVTEEDFGSGKQKFQGKTDKGMEHTSYGQQVLILDYKGYIKTLQNATVRAELKALR